MKKRICFLISAILLLMSFSSCAPTEATSYDGPSLDVSNKSVCALKYECKSVKAGESLDVVCFLASPIGSELPFKESVLKIYAKGFEISSSDGKRFLDEGVYDYSEFMDEDNTIKRFVKFSFKLAEADAAEGAIDFEFRCYPEINHDVTQTAVIERISFSVKNGVAVFS